MGKRVFELGAFATILFVTLIGSGKVNAQPSLKLGIARLLTVNGKSVDRPSILVRMNSEPGSGEAFSIIDEEFTNLNSKGQPTLQKGILDVVDGVRIILTLPGPRVDKILIAQILSPGRKEHVERSLEVPRFDESQLADLKRAMKELNFNGTDQELDSYLESKRIQRINQTEVWLVNDVQMGEGVVLERFIDASAFAPKNLDYASWGRGTIRINIQGACAAITQRLAASRVEEGQSESSPLRHSNDVIFSRALSTLKQ